MAGPNAPSIVSIAQASQTVVVGIRQAATTGDYPVVQFQLFRSPTGTGAWGLLDSPVPSDVALTTVAFDTKPVFGQAMYYAASAVDSHANVSPKSTAETWAAFLAAPQALPANLSSGAVGNYPLLGSDVFLNGQLGEAVIGPNGDLLTVNGLECLAQDLRIRIFTEVGELLCHPTFGFGPSKLIGTGQGDRHVQAQYLRTLIIDVLRSDPRVERVLSCRVQLVTPDGWRVAYELMAIGVEDPLQHNQVYPFGKAA